MAHIQYWKQRIHSGVNSVLHMSPSAGCHWPCNTPKSLLVSSCNFLQATIQTTKQKRPKRLQTLIFTVKFHWSCTNGNRQVPNHRMFQIIKQVHMLTSVPTGIFLLLLLYLSCAAKSEEYSIWISLSSAGSSSSVFSGVFKAEKDEVGDGARRYHTRCCTATLGGLVEHVPEVCLYHW